MLESPLRLLSYLSLRDRFGKKLIVTHELTLLSYHLTGNLWVQDDVDLLNLADSISLDLDNAMAVRRDGMFGAPTPDGILTRFKDTHFAKIITQIEDRPEAVAVGFGLMLLELNEQTVQSINEYIEEILKRTATDGRLHDATVCIPSASRGLTIHCSRLKNSLAATRLMVHCNVRKYAQKAERWFGLAVRQNGSIRFVIELDSPWMFDADMENIKARYIRPI